MTMRTSARPASRRSGAWIAGGALVLLAAAVGGYAVTSSPDEGTFVCERAADVVHSGEDPSQWRDALVARLRCPSLTVGAHSFEWHYRCAPTALHAIVPTPSYRMRESYELYLRRGVGGPCPDLEIILVKDVCLGDRCAGTPSGPGR